MNAERTTKGRAFHRKSQSGCKTCKFRRVKCDEAKPICQRCQAFGVECDGYNIKAPAKKRWTALPLLMPNNLQSSSFNNQNEYQYFVYFRDDFSAELSGPLSINFFKNVVLRACEDELPLRDLIISIAALAQFTKTAGSKTSHHQFAVKQYGKALRGIQQVISTRRHEDATRIALIAALLIFCFESLHGDEGTALAHIMSALKLMQRRLLPTSRQYSKIRAVFSIPNFEDELLGKFVKLDNMLVARIDPMGSADTSLLGLAYVDDEFQLPAVFTNILEAREYLEHFQYLAIPYLSHLGNIFSTGDLGPTQKPATIETYDTLSAQLHQWGISFRPLLANAYNKRHNFVPTATLHLMFLSTQLCITRVYHAVTSTTTGISITKAEKILELCRAVVADPSFKRVFVFDCGIVPVLFSVFMIFEGRQIKEEAIRILRSIQPRRELTWDAKMVADIGDGMLAAEI